MLHFFLNKGLNHKIMIIFFLHVFYNNCLVHKRYKWFKMFPHIDISLFIHATGVYCYVINKILCFQIYNTYIFICLQIQRFHCN